LGGLTYKQQEKNMQNDSECRVCGARLVSRHRVEKTMNFTWTKYYNLCPKCDFYLDGKKENRRKVFPENPRSEWTSDRSPRELL